MKSNTIKRALASGVIGLASLLPAGCNLPKSDYERTLEHMGIASEPIKISSWDRNSATIKVSDPDGIFKVEIYSKALPAGRSTYHLKNKRNLKSYKIKIDNINDRLVVRFYDNSGDIVSQSFINKDGEIYSGVVAITPSNMFSPHP